MNTWRTDGHSPADFESDYRALFERNPDSIVIVGADGRIQDLNEATLKLAGGLPREQLIGEHFSSFLRGPNLERGYAFFQRALSGETVRYEIDAVANGRDIKIDVTQFPKIVDGAITGLYCIIQDTTARHAAQRRMEMQAQRIRDLYLLATTPEYSDASMMSMLQTGCRLLGMESGALITANPAISVEMRYDVLEFFSGRDEALNALAERVLEQSAPVIGESSGGGAYPSWIGTKFVAAGEIQGALVFFSTNERQHRFEDIDNDTLALMSALAGASLERRRSRTHLRALAYYDSLTGLPNRAYFRDSLREALLDLSGHPNPVAVIVFSLDRFKDVNDSLGLAAGDRLLQTVARCLVETVGKDGFVARMTGDEFGVLVVGERVTTAREFAMDLLEELRRPFAVGSYQHYLTVSAGIASYPNDARDDETLVRNAHLAVREAKETTSGLVVYSYALEERLHARIGQEQHLRAALERGDFELHFQPIMDLRSGEVAAIEALIRWQDPKRGTIYPDQFIPAAESSGLIVELGDFVTAEAARTLARLRHRGTPVRMSINISARQFHQPDLCDRILSQLHKHGVPPSCLEVEITESMTLVNIAGAIDTIRKIKEAGVGISVDDFGTGHSSLNYLRRFAVDEIKIDRTFVAGIGHQPSDETIIKTIIAMGQSLDLCVVAEGVETREQIEFLERAGCERVQGYYVSRPLPVIALEELLSRGTLRKPG